MPAALFRRVSSPERSEVILRARGRRASTLAPVEHVIVALGDITPELAELGSWSRPVVLSHDLATAIQHTTTAWSLAGFIVCSRAALTALEAAAPGTRALLLTNEDDPTPLARNVERCVAPPGSAERVAAIRSFVASVHSIAGLRALRFELACEGWSLTPREAHVLWCLWRGWRGAAIGRAMGLADSSVRALLSQLRAKTDERPFADTIAAVNAAMGAASTRVSFEASGERRIEHAPHAAVGALRSR